MRDSDQIKLLRTGSVRATPARGARSGRGVSPDALVPEIESFGNGPFSASDLQALAQRLQDPRWTRGTRNIYGLEGLLTALLVLPLGLRLGTWLPLIWSEGGWKVPAALQGAENSREFLDLTIGFMRHLDRGFSATPPRFDSVVTRLAKRDPAKAAHAEKAWAHGFGLAVSEVPHLEMPHDSAAEHSLVAIAMLIQPAFGSADPARKPTQALKQAVLTLVGARTSRGPLGPLQ